MDQLERVKREFARQADTFAASAAITDEQLTSRLIEGFGSAAGGPSSMSPAVRAL
jgi:hypothetical protein